jgi:hypothetical protein
MKLYQIYLTRDEVNAINRGEDFPKARASLGAMHFGDFYGRQYYTHVADIDVVRRFDAANGAPRGETVIPGASCLDDVAVGPDGSVYVSDRGVGAEAGSATGTDAIWRIAPDGALTALAKGEALGQPAALVARPQGLYVVSHRHGVFAQVDYRGVRTELATELARVDVAISTRLATAGYTAPLDAAGVRSAVGLASANLDTQFGDLPTAAENATAVSSIDIDGQPLQAALRIIGAIVAGEVSGAGTATEVFVGLNGTDTRVTMTVDASGNRSAAVYS